jgi:hypothetical protein
MQVVVNLTYSSSDANLPSSFTNSLFLTLWAWHLQVQSNSVLESVSEASLLSDFKLESSGASKLFASLGYYGLNKSVVKGDFAPVFWVEKDRCFKQNLRWFSGPFHHFENYCEHLGHSQSIDRGSPEAICWRWLTWCFCVDVFTADHCDACCLWTMSTYMHAQLSN